MYKCRPSSILYTRSTFGQSDANYIVSKSSISSSSGSRSSLQNNISKLNTNMKKTREDKIHTKLLKEKRHRLDCASLIIEGICARVHGVDIAINRNIIQQAGTSDREASTLSDGTGRTERFARSWCCDVGIDVEGWMFAIVISLDAAVQCTLC